MQLGTLIPQNDIGGTPAALREFAQTAEGLGYDFLEAADHVLGVNVASRPDWQKDRNTSADWFHDPFVMFGFLAGVTKLGFSTGVLILAHARRCWSPSRPPASTCCAMAASASASAWAGTRWSSSA
jgi:alkanesulfonate monooxygenase SsuD/methylene tetrahydromethanopterin reductase-like flavin-dependent oxidoreductase (luciferase family)